MTPKPLPFTFGNHMHWVDMQWRRGYRVLPDSIDDMLALCAAVDAKGNVNFDGVGYEKLASEAPQALHRLRNAVQAGTIEVVGATYGQPYGLLCGGESNVRQRVFGARAVRRLLGVWPRTFWEQEFDFFPQLPQMLAGCGFTGASLFFQWTSHTPTVPEEDVPLVLWEGCDGTRLPTIAKTKLCLHRWPEDFDAKLDLALAVERPALLQWLELLPSPDWTCRSDVLLPRLRELFADARFDIRPCTLGELIELLRADGEPPVRHYTLDDVFHGITLGTNNDVVPRASRRAETMLLCAESLSATLGLVGRPYATSDVYPSWELDEGWRELLQAQHHGNHEREKRRASVGNTSFERAHRLAHMVLDRGLEHLGYHVDLPDDVDVPYDEAVVVCNTLGWERDILLVWEELGEDWDQVGSGLIAERVPAFGWRTITRNDADLRVAPAFHVDEDERSLTLRTDGLGVRIARETGRIEEIHGPLGRVETRIGDLSGRAEDADVDFGSPHFSIKSRSGNASIYITRRGSRAWVDQEITLHPIRGAIALTTIVRDLPCLDGGYRGALRLHVELPNDAAPSLHVDSPFAVHPVRADAVNRDRREYPRGDRTASETWFEPVDRAFTSTSFVDLEAEGRGVLCVHGGRHGWFATDSGASVVLDSRDPWATDHWQSERVTRITFVPHASALRPAEAVRIAAEFRILTPFARPLGCRTGGTGFPRTFGPIDVLDAKSVRVEAFYRECRTSFDHVENAFGPDVRNPYVVRLVEYDGETCDVTLRVPGPCALAARTDLLGAVVEPLTVTAIEPPDWSPSGHTWSAIGLSMRPREIATVMLDLELGRHQPLHPDQQPQV